MTRAAHSPNPWFWENWETISALHLHFQQEDYCPSELWRHTKKKRVELWSCWGANFIPNDFVIFESHLQCCYSKWQATSTTELFTCAITSPAEDVIAQVKSSSFCHVTCDHNGHPALFSLLLNTTPDPETRFLFLAPMLRPTAREDSSQGRLPFKPCLRQCSITTKNCWRGA